MKLDNLTAIEQMKVFLEGSQPVAFAVATSKDERYQFVETLLKWFDYARLKRSEKGIMIKFLLEFPAACRGTLKGKFENRRFLNIN